MNTYKKPTYTPTTSNIYQLLPDHLLVLVLVFLDVPSLLSLSLTCKDLNTILAPSPSGYTLPILPDDIVEYPYSKVTENGKCWKILNPVLLTSLTSEPHHFFMMDRLVTSIKEPYLRLWLWRHYMSHIININIYPNIHIIPRGLILSSYTRWCNQNILHLSLYAKRVKNTLSWLHIKSFPKTEASETDLKSLLSSCQYTLKSLLFQSVSTNIDICKCVNDSNLLKLKTLIVRKYFWKLSSNLPSQVNKIKIVVCHFPQAAILQNLLDLHSNLKCLHLEDITCETDNTIPNVISNKCCSFTHLKELNLINIPFTDQLAESLGIYTSKLLKLKINFTSLNTQMLRLLTINNHSLVHLDVAGNELDTNALIVVEQILSYPGSRLQKLNLSANFITCTNVLELLGGLSCTTTLTHLDLSDNYLRFSGYTLLYCFLTSNIHRLKYIDLSANQICLDNDYSDYLICDIGLLLRKCSTIKTYKIARNTFIPYTSRKYLEKEFYKDFKVVVTL